MQSNTHNAALMDQNFMILAINLAAQALQVGEVPVGALVVCDGQVIGQGYNQTISMHDPCGHAEIMALRQVSQAIGNHRLSGCDLYVTLEPCIMCVGAIIHFRTQRLGLSNLICLTTYLRVLFLFDNVLLTLSKHKSYQRLYSVNIT